jgi:arsenate reductase
VLRLMAGGTIDRVVFACVHNAGRSQMAAALLASMTDPSRVEVVSAGTDPADRVHPAVVAAMREIGIDLASHVPQRLSDEMMRTATLLVTMGCGEACPVIPGVERDDWPLADPKDRSASEVRLIRDDIERRVSALVDARGWRSQSRGGEDGGGAPAGGPNPHRARMR